MARDSETQELIQPGRIAVWAKKLRSPFTRIFWEDLLEDSGGETLVDRKLLSYAYLEAGVIETLSACVLLAVVLCFYFFDLG